MPKVHKPKSAPFGPKRIKRLRIAQRKIDEGEAALKAPREKQLIIEALAGKNGRTETMNAWDLTLGYKITGEVSKTMLLTTASWPPDIKPYFITIVMDTGVTPDRAPTPDIEMLSRMLALVMKLTKLHGIAKIEVHPLMNHPGGGQGRSLLWHLHIIAWTDQPFDIAAATRQIAGIPGLVCSFGAKTVVIKPIGDTDTDMRQVCEYITKPICSAKNLKAKKDEPERVKMKNTVKGLRGEFALRVGEGLSQLSPFDLLKGFGDGRAVVADVRKEVTTWHRARKVTGLVLPRTFDAWLFWYTLRTEYGSKLYLPYRFSVAVLRGPLRRRSRTPARPGGPRRRATTQRLQKRQEFSLDDL